MVKNVEITVLSIRNISIENKVKDTCFNTTKFQDLVVAIGEVGGH